MTANEEVQDWRRCIRAGTPVVGIYCAHGAWQTGRLQRVRRLNALVWQAQPWGTPVWHELKSWRQIWAVFPDVEEVRHG